MGWNLIREYLRHFQTITLKLVPDWMQISFVFYFFFNSKQQIVPLGSLFCVLTWALMYQPIHTFMSCTCERNFHFKLLNLENHFGCQRKMEIGMTNIMGINNFVILSYLSFCRIYVSVNSKITLWKPRRENRNDKKAKIKDRSYTRKDCWGKRANPPYRSYT